MRPLTPSFILTLGLAVFLAATLISAKPPAATRQETAAPTPAAAASDGSADPGTELALARWLVVPSGTPDAIVLPFSQVVRAATGKAVLPFDTANPADTAQLTAIGAALDLLLPKMNRPDSPARMAAASGDAAIGAARFEDELRGALGAGPTALGEPPADRSYPAFFLPGLPAWKPCYVSVALYPAGGERASVAFALLPGIASRRFSADGGCLLIGVEYDGGLGRGTTVLNWEVTDLSRLKVRFQPVFQATLHDALQPGAVLTDGRKGRD